ncbi:MAG: GntR family transcriptional regulator [Anaerolineae bacterium]
MESSQSKVRPPHIQVEDALTQMIESLSPGDQLPPEPDLAKQLGVSRATLREVMRSFVERGILVRKHGVGTFVASRIPILETGMEVLESLASLAHRIGLETKVRHLNIVERKAIPHEVTGLEYPEGADVEVLAVSRVITVEDEPVADLLDVVPLEYLRQEDLGPDFKGSVLDVLLERGTPMLTISRTEIMATAAYPPCSNRLELSKGAALLKLIGQLYSYDEKVVDYSVSYFVPGHFKFHVMRRVNRS